MPIKLPKSFARRKSSGNILEDVEPNSQSSFRVFERPGTHRSMTDGVPLTKRMSEGNLVHSVLEDPGNIFAGTEQPLGKTRYDRTRPMDLFRKRLTSHRLSGATYESSTSTRMSSSSTLPSSTEIPSPDDSSSPHSRIQDIPVPPPLSGALRAAGRTFSFGGRFKSSAPSAPPRHATPDASTRQRALTGSTDSTATPPKLPDANFNLGTDSDDFGKMFEHLGKRESALLREPSPQRTQQHSSSAPTQTLPGIQMENRAVRPAPISTDRSAEIEPSPYSWGSRHSEEGLLNNPDSEPNRASPSQSTSETITSFRRPSPGPNQMLGATTTHRALERLRRPSDGLRRSVIYSGVADASPIDDEDAKLVRQSLLWSKESSSPPVGTPPLDKGKTVSYTEHLTSDPDEIIMNRHSPELNDKLDSSIADHARLAVQFAENIPKSASPGNKVMTPSQFEHYRQQQELRRSNSDATRSDDESVNDEFDEDDEVEKQREAERQRRKQEAHMSVYRQQMMKVTGQPAASPLLRPSVTGASSSTPNLANRLSNPGDKSSSGKSSEEDDEEVPLGILAAHGFPNRNRPPNRLNNTNSNPNLRASMLHPYTSSSNSVTGAEHENRNSLPVFARNLPRDPYFGASLVNPSNRESLALGGGSVYGGSSSPVPPGGLVGVIANEERARAMRRGSPNTQAMYDMGGVPRPYSMMPPPPPQPQISPSEQAQVQLSQQMSSMMQMQMQWMQQMMHMQGMQGTPPPIMNGGIQAPPMMGGRPMSGTPTGSPSLMVPSMPAPPSIAGGSGRPVSMAGPFAPPHFDANALSALDPTIAMRRTGSPMPNLSAGGFPSSMGNYAPSIAPSERSNAGLASRYRPVSVMAGDPGLGGSHLSKSWNKENQNPLLSVPKTNSHIPKSSNIATVTLRPVSRASQSSPSGSKPRHGSEDEDDDEAWADMLKKRDKKKNNWKLKRGTSSFGDLLSAVH